MLLINNELEKYGTEIVRIMYRNRSEIYKITDVQLLVVCIDVRVTRLDTSDSGHGSEAGSCEHSIELSGSIKSWEYLEWLPTVSLSGRTELHGV